MAGTILLADDSLTIQKVVELTFADTGYSVVAVSTGDELLHRLGQVRPDVIICDVIMPGRDGYDICQQIKSSPATLHIPVILLTGTFEPFDRDRALAAGCSEIISKPFEARKLVETVERLAREGHRAAPPPEPVTPHDGAVRPALPEVPAPPEPFLAPPPPVEPVAPTPPAVTEPFMRFEPAVEQPPTEPEHPEEALDFTATGFAEMEAAGHQAAAEPEHLPAEGLEFERHDLPAVEPPVEVEELPLEPPWEAAEPVPPQPVSAEPAPSDAPWTGGAFRGESPWTDRTWDESGEHQAAAEVEEPADSWLERPAEGGPAAAADTYAGTEEPFGGSEVPILQPWEEAAQLGAADTAPFVEPAPPEPEPSLEAIVAPLEVSSFTTAPFSRAEVLAPATAPEPVAPVEAEPFAPVEELEPLQPGPEAAPEPESELLAPALAAVEAIPVAADTQPSVKVPAAAGEVRLSDEDVERIARRVVELASGLIEQIAWEVMPDMAEIVVRERVRAIEAEAERRTGEPAS